MYEPSSLQRYHDQYRNDLFKQVCEAVREEGGWGTYRESESFIDLTNAITDMAIALAEGPFNDYYEQAPFRLARKMANHGIKYETVLPYLKEFSGRQDYEQKMQLKGALGLFSLHSQTSQLIGGVSVHASNTRVDRWHAIGRALDYLSTALFYEVMYENHDAKASQMVAKAVREIAPFIE